MDPKEPVVPGSSQDDDALSTTSSMSIILAEEIDSLETRKEDQDLTPVDLNKDEVEVAVDPLMGQSQYAQVLFNDVEDFYENDNDLICNFTFYLTTWTDFSATNGNDEGITIKHKEGDRVGIFRVPYLKPEEALCFVKVKKDNVSDGKGTVTFTNDYVPKEEDFYQFQYLRNNENLLGASVPFQLKTKKTARSSLKETKEEQETQTEGLQSVNDHLVHLSTENKRLEQSLSKATGDCARLLQLSENLTDQLEGKSLSFIELEKNLQTEKQSYDQLKTDVAFLIQEKIILEQKYEKNNEHVKKLQQQVDELNGKCQAKDREYSLLKEEKDQIASKLDDARAIISAVTDSKLMAIKLLNERVAKEQALKKELEELKATSVQEKPSLESGSSPRWDRLEARLEELELSLSTTDEKYGKLVGDLANDLSSLKSVMTTRAPSLRSDSVQSEIGGDSIGLLNSNFIDGAIATTDDIDAHERDEITPVNSATCSSPARPDGDVLPIPILPVQTVEAMASAAKGSVQSIKQLFTPFRPHSTNPFRECRIDIEGPCQATTVIDTQPTAMLSQQQGKTQEELIDEVKVSLGQKSVTIPDGRDDIFEREEGESEVQSPTLEGQNGNTTSVVLTDDGRAITYTEDGLVSCPICTKEFQRDQMRELEFHVEEHISTGLTCPICAIVLPKDMQRDFENHVSLHFDEESSMLEVRREDCTPDQPGNTPGFWPFDNL